MTKLFVFCNVPLYDDDNYNLIFLNIKENLLKLISNFSNYKIVILASTLWETHSAKSLSKTNIFFQNFSKKYNTEYYLLCNKSANQLTDSWDRQNTIDLSFFRNKLFHSNLIKKQNFNKSWNNSKFCFLFLTGKLNKKNRIIPLLEFAKLGLLNETDCTWSLNYDAELANSVYKVLVENNLNYNKEDFISFLKKYAKIPDAVSFSRVLNTTHYDGVPFDRKLYANTSLSVISESETDSRHVWITEKTWRAILNKHPFLIIGQPYTLRHLQNLGYRTFENYLPYRYDNIENFLKRNEAICKNLQWLKENWSQLDFKKISKDIEYNYNLAELEHKIELKAFNKKIKLKKHDMKVHLGLYVDGRDQPNLINIKNDHVCYYNWANYDLYKFWSKNE
jgi:hypothetical protein